MGVDNDTALIAGPEGESLSYAELDKLGSAIAHEVPERSLVFLVTSNSVPAVAGYVGLLKKDAVVTMIRRETTPEQFSRLCGAYLPQYVWAPRDFVSTHREGLGKGSVVYSDRGYDLLSTGTPAPTINPDTSLLITTSGSTGTPKFVRLTRDNLLSNARSIVEYQRITKDDRAITTLPFSYTYGISIVNSHLLAGASIVLTEDGLLSRDFWQLLTQTKATNFGGVPYNYQMLEKLHFEQLSLPSLRFLSQAGGRLGEHLQEVFGTICAQKGIEFFVMYGQTEATARMSWLPPERCLEKLGSIGIAIPGGSFELIDTDGSVIRTPKKPGELIYHGANVTQGYATCREDLAKGDERGGVLHTGDIAYVDEDGYYYVVGRLKRFLKIYGNRVNLDEVEHLLAEHGVESACVGTDDHMVVYTTSGDLEAIREHLGDATHLNDEAFDVRHIDAIPHMASGKVDYHALDSD